VIPLSLGDGAFNGYMIYFSVVVSTFSLVLKLVFEPLVIVRIVP
jgi:hypothetical protein